MPDSLIGHCLKNGEFTMRSIYHIRMEYKERVNQTIEIIRNSKGDDKSLLEAL